MGCNDKKRKYGTKTAVSITGASANKQLVAISELLKVFTRVNVNKYIVCFFVYVLKSILFSGRPIYDLLVEGKQNVNMIAGVRNSVLSQDEKVKQFVIELANAVVIQDPDELNNRLLEVFASIGLQVPKTLVQQAIDDAMEMFRARENNEFFKLYV